MHKMDWLKTVMLQADNGEPFPNEEQRDCLRRMNRLTANSMGMSYRLEHALSPYVTFLIMPIFALANAGVRSLAGVHQHLPLFVRNRIGRHGRLLRTADRQTAGIFLAGGAVRSGLAEMPAGANWRMLFAVACLGGIGFTMSLFVDSLAYTDPGPDRPGARSPF